MSSSNRDRDNFEDEKSWYEYLLDVGEIISIWWEIVVLIGGTIFDGLWRAIKHKILPK